MNDQQTTEGARMSDRYAALAAKSAGEAQGAVNRAELAADSDEPRDAKRARREAKEWAELALKDAMRAHGAYSAEVGRFEAVHEAADAALKRAEAARDRTIAIYRELRGGKDE